MALHPWSPKVGGLLWRGCYEDPTSIFRLLPERRGQRLLAHIASSARSTHWRGAVIPAAREALAARPGRRQGVAFGRRPGAFRGGANRVAQREAIQPPEHPASLYG